MAQDTTIPTPLAPARPIQSPVGMTTPATFPGGQTGVIDGNGNIFQYDANGALQYKTAIPGASNVPVPPSVPDPWDLISNPFGPGVSASDLGNMAKDAAVTATKAVADAATRTVFGISLYDAVSIMLGLIFVLAALFSFSSTRDGLKTLSKKAAKTALEAA